MPSDQPFASHVEAYTADIEKRRQAIILELENKKAKIEAAGHEFSFLNLWMWIPDENGITPMHIMLNDKILDKMVMTSVLTERGESVLSTQTSRKSFINFLDEVMKKLSVQGRLNIKEIIDLVKELNVKNKKKDKDKEDNESIALIQKRITGVLEPIYIEMRLLGFSDYDLIR